MVNYHSLVGRQWEYGKFDCFTIVRDWFALQGIALPDFERPENLVSCDSIFLREAQNLGFMRVDVNRRRPGDVVIMRLGTASPMHAAMLVDYDQILHQRQDSLSAIEPLGRYYVSSIAAVFRYAAGRPTAG